MQPLAASLEHVDHWLAVPRELLEVTKVGLLLEWPLEVGLPELDVLESSLLHAFELPKVDWLLHARAILVLPLSTRFRALP